MVAALTEREVAVGSFWRRYVHDFEIALESIRANKLKSFLTALGIIFGVAAVISMLAIGSGAQREILEQMKQVGVNNILVKVIPQAQQGGEKEDGEGSKQNKRYSPGLCPRDVAALRAAIPTLRYVSPMVQYDGVLQSMHGRLSGTIVGTSVDYFSLYRLCCTTGHLFTQAQAGRAELVCVIGHEVRTKLFGQHAPIGGRIKFAGLWFTVLGVLEEGGSASNGAVEDLGPVSSAAAIFVPLETLSRRYYSRTVRKITEESRGIQKSFDAPLDRLVVQVSDTRYLEATARVMDRMLARLHAGVQDYAVIIPEKLLQQQQRTTTIFNWVLGAIAGISLLVGGIGIMNIMFASVMERIKEIGTRLAIGAKRADIVAQFLWEAILISVSGGLVGILVGIALSLLITLFAGIETIVSPLSVLISFGVSVGVGLIFGLAPARRAARRSPIESLRYE